MTGRTRQRAGLRAQAERASTLATALALVAAFVADGAHARPAAIAPNVDATSDRDEADALPYLQCVPFARQASGIQLYGDAHTWWDQADGQYARGREPKVGAVMSFRPHGAMVLGHVAMVSKVIDERTVLLRHANWSPIDGRRGQVEMDVRAVDVSPANDWSEVRVWYAPIGDLGTTHWPVNGFIYKHKPRPGVERMTTLAAADNHPVTRLSASHASLINANFLVGITPDDDAPARPTRNWLVARAPASATVTHTAPALRDDPIGRIIAARMKPAVKP